MLCDFIIVVDIVKFGQFEIMFGVILGVGGIQCLMCFVGKFKVIDMVLIGWMMDVEEVECSGLVSRIVLVDDFLEEFFKVVEKIVDFFLFVVMMVKESVDCVYEMIFLEGVCFEWWVFQVMFVLEDQKEGMLVFLEKCVLQFNNK